MNAQLARPVRKQGQGDELARLPLLDGVHVLVVDDDEDAREAVAAVVESWRVPGGAPPGAARGVQVPPSGRTHVLLEGNSSAGVARAPGVPVNSSPPTEP